jgi:hypothetical protein
MIRSHDRGVYDAVDLGGYAASPRSGTLVSSLRTVTTQFRARGGTPDVLQDVWQPVA